MNSDHLIYSFQEIDVWKSFLIKTIFDSLTKLLFYRSGDPNKPIVLMPSPTGVATVNINGTTIHSGWIIPCKGKLFVLNDKNCSEMKNKYSEVKIVIIDHISMGIDIL